MADLADVIAGQFRTRREERSAAASAAAAPEPVVEQPVVDAGAPEDQKARPIAFKAAYVSDDGVIYGIGAYATNVDLDNDVVATKALVKMAYDFCAASERTFKANHQENLDADLVASMPGAPILKSGRILTAGEALPDDDPITAICLKSEPIAWFVGVRPHDPEIAKAAKAGAVAGFSFGAYVEREAIKE
jgi:Putative phage serine protease XkdF